MELLLAKTSQIPKEEVVAPAIDHRHLGIGHGEDGVRHSGAEAAGDSSCRGKNRRLVCLTPLFCTSDLTVP